MPALLLFLWLAGFVQVAIACANLLLPAKLNYRENLSRVFAAVTFGFAGELASGRGLGRFLAAAIAAFWLARTPVQLLYYDVVLRRDNRSGDVALTAGALFLAVTYGAAFFAHGL